MNKRFSFSVGLLVGTLSLVTGAGCGSGSDGASPESIDILQSPPGFPFVVGAAVVDDQCDTGTAHSCALGKNPQAGSTTAALSQPQNGKVCLEGTVAPGGGAFVVFWFTQYNALENYNITAVLKPFDAAALGITQVAFSVDTPPTNGITVQASVLKRLDCPAGGSDCRTGGFTLMTAPNSNVPVNIKDAGPEVAPFASFEQTDPTLPTTFDTTQLDAVLFTVIDGPYNFCVHDFKFLDPTGNEVAPS
jgi:hypothetical protein